LAQAILFDSDELYRPPNLLIFFYYEEVAEKTQKPEKVASFFLIFSVPSET
jgi:hypothetical protein